MSPALTLAMSPAPDEDVAMAAAAETAHACPSCGADLSDAAQRAEEAQQQIEELRGQIRLLTQKATAAVDKWADYEDEIQQLKTQTQNSPESGREPTALQSVPFDERSISPKVSTPGFQNRFSSFLISRKSTPNLNNASSAPTTPSTNELVAALTREQSLRQAAERKLDDSSGELEELSAQLFQQANEMVATERKARAKLEERVEVLEKRDVEKRKRLDRLEAAVQRIHRVKGLLAPIPPMR